MFATNFFDSLASLNKSLVSYKRIKVPDSYKLYTEGFEKISLLQTEKTVQKKRQKLKRKSLSEHEGPFMQQITSSFEEMSKSSKSKSTFEDTDIEKVSTQSDENVELLDETNIKRKKKKHKKKSESKKPCIEAHKVTSPELKVLSTRHKNKFVSPETAHNNLNFEVSSEDDFKEPKNRLDTQSAQLELDDKNIENDENVERDDIIELIIRVKNKYERKLACKNFMKHLNIEKKQKRHKKKSTFHEPDNKNICLQNESRITAETASKGKKKRHKNKKAFKDLDIAVQVDGSEESFGETAVFEKELDSEQSVQNVTNQEVLAEELIEGKKKKDFMQFDDVNYVAQHKEAVKVSKLLKKKKSKKRGLHDASFSEIINKDQIKKADKAISDKIEVDHTNRLKNAFSLQVGKKKKHKRKYFETKEDQDTYLLKNKDSIQEDNVKRKKHKKEFIYVAEDNDTSVLKNGDIPENQEKCKKELTNNNLQMENKGTSPLENRPLQMNNNVKIEDFTNKKTKKGKFKLFSQFATDEYFAGKVQANLQSTKKLERTKVVKSTYLDPHNHRRKSQNNSDVQHNFNKKIKEEIEDLDSLITQNSSEESAASFRNSKVTLPRIKEENNSKNTFSTSEDDEVLLKHSPLSIHVNNLDLKEEPVEFEIPLLHSSKNLRKIFAEERKSLESQGVIFKSGKFSNFEDSVLRRNYNEFIRQFCVKDPRILLWSKNYSNKKDIKAFLSAKFFYVRLGRDLNDRPLNSIYRRARYLFQPFERTRKKLNKDDVNRIKSYTVSWETGGKKLGILWVLGKQLLVQPFNGMKNQ